MESIKRTFDSYIMESFEFESGAILENVSVEYFTRGVPEYDGEGNITNAIIYCSTYKGNYSVFDRNDVEFSNQSIINDYFFIKIVSIGIPESCSPSSTELRYDFPTYTIKDRVNFKKQFLAEKFKINKFFGVIGEGFGGYEVYTWASEYPDDMEFIIVLNSAFKTHGYCYILLKCNEAILESSEDIYSEAYSSNLSRMSVAVFKLMFASYLPRNVIEKLSMDEIDVLMEDYVDESLFVDIHDFNSSSKCLLNFNVEDKLSNIKAKSLILGIRGFLLFNPDKDTVPLENIIENSQIKVFDNIKEDYYENEDFSELTDTIISFLKNLEK